MKKYLCLIILIILFMPFLVNAKSEYFYDVMKNKTFTKEYTYSHQDSMDPSLSTEKIYYWYPSSQEDIDSVSNMNNVIFGNYCWQLIRTTDTGGVKLLYNGAPTDGKCTSTGTTATIGSTKYAPNGSVGYVGYMYDKAPTPGSKGSYGEIFQSRGALTSINWYADDMIFNPSTRKYSLVDPIAIEERTDYSYLVGKYVISSSYSPDSATSVYYVVGVDSDYFYYRNLGNGNKLINLSDTFTYGDDFTDNGDGTYTIVNPTTINTVDYYPNMANIKNKFLCKNGVNATCNEIRYVFSTDGTSISYYKPNLVYKFASGFTYNNGEYTLTDDAEPIWNFSSNSSIIRTKHYTCLNMSGICENISFVFYIYNRAIVYYTISDGKNIDQFLDDLLYKDDVNKNDSLVKTMVDNWYRDNLLDYTDYIDDTIYCSSREFNSKNGFKENGILTDRISFRTTLACNNETDKFSVSNPKAKLTYPIALASDYELSSFISSSKNRAIGVTYWVMTPTFVYNAGTAVQTVLDNGSMNTSWNSTNAQYVRPAISLKANMGYEEGTGSKDNPYIAIPIQKYKVDVVVKNETKDINIELEDFTKVEAGEEVKFKITPIKGYKVTNIEIIDEDDNSVDFEETTNKNEYIFTMPENNVTIIPSYERVSNSVNTDNNDHTKEIKIDVNDASAVVYEDVVIFRVDPEEGYELIDIEIIDEEGNKVEYRKTDNENEYSFVMPDVDVTIKPVYKKLDVPDNNQNNIPNNPKTGASIISLVVLMIIFGLSIFYVKRKSKIIRD